MRERGREKEREKEGKREGDTRTHTYAHARTRTRTHTHTHFLFSLLACSLRGMLHRPSPSWARPQPTMHPPNVQNTRPQASSCSSCRPGVRWSASGLPVADQAQYRSSSSSSSKKRKQKMRKKKKGISKGKATWKKEQSRWRRLGKWMRLAWGGQTRDMNSRSYNATKATTAIALIEPTHIHPLLRSLSF